MRSPRLLLLLANLALFAAWLGKWHPKGHTWSDAARRRTALATDRLLTRAREMARGADADGDH